MSRWGLRSLAVSVAGIFALTACSPSAPTTLPPESTESVVPASIDFAIADAPTMTIGPESELRVDSAEVTVLNDRLLVGGALGITAFSMDDNTPVWTLKPFGDPVGAGSTRSVPLRTSSAAGGIVLAAYTEECVWEKAPCEGAPEGTRAILGVAAVAAEDRSVVWRSELWTGGPEGSDTEDDDIYLEPVVFDADGTGVLVTLSTNHGTATPSGTPGMTTILLDAATGKEKWRVDGFRGTYLLDDTVLGVTGDPATLVSTHPYVVNTVIDRATGKKSADLDTSAELWVQYAGGPGAVVEDRAQETSMETRNIYLLGPDGKRVESGADAQNLPQASCPTPHVEGTLACAVMARSTDSVLVSWFDGEAAPTSAAAPLTGHQQLWAISGDVLLVSENGYQINGSAGPATWFAARRDGTVIGQQYPGTAVAASEDYVVTRTVDAKGRSSLHTWKITEHP